MATPKITLKNWFKAGLKPLETQFAAWLDSYWHKDESIPMSSVSGLEDALNNTATADQIELLNEAKEDKSNKGNANGYASLDGDGKVPLAQLPSGSSGTVTSVGALAPLFTVANATTTPSFTAINQNANLIYAGPTSGGAAAPSFRALVAADIPSIDASKITTGVFNIAQIPAAALERVYVYAGGATTPQSAGLTTSDVQNGDVVKINSTGLMYVVKNDAALNSAGSYEVFVAGLAASVPFTGVTGLPTSLSGYGITDAWKVTGTTTFTGAVTVDLATTNLNFLNGNVMLAPTGSTIAANTRLDVKGTGATDATYTQRWADSSDVTLGRMHDNGSLLLANTYSGGVGVSAALTKLFIKGYGTSSTTSGLVLANSSGNVYLNINDAGSIIGSTFTLTTDNNVGSNIDVGAGVNTVGFTIKGKSSAIFASATARTTFRILHGQSGSGSHTTLSLEPSYNTGSGDSIGLDFNPSNITTLASLTAIRAVLGGIQLAGSTSPAQITSNQNDYNYTGLKRSFVQRWDSNASRDITGLLAGSAGEYKIIFNVGANNIVLKHEDAGSTAANRFSLNADITLLPGNGAMIWYDTASSRWRVASKY